MGSMNIPMVDLKNQYLKIKDEIDGGILETISSTQFIGGEKVRTFKENLEKYLDVRHVIPCANGTDALQIALMSLDLKPGDEVIVPAFTYVATAEVIALLQLQPVMVEVDPNTFNLTADIFEKAITPKTKAVVPVHLFGQTCDMEPIMAVAREHGIYVIEDNAQTIGATYTYDDGHQAKSGTIGHIGTTSFYPSKNLGCYGDGGALFTNDDQLAKRIQMIANHGQVTRYYHDVIGCNSRLDAIQAVVLNTKLKYLDDYCRARQKVAQYYDKALAGVAQLTIPVREPKSNHVFHQYVLRIDGNRDGMVQYLKDKGVGCMIYYPLPLHHQKAFSPFFKGGNLPISEQLCKEVFAIPIHTEMEEQHLEYVTQTIIQFFD